MEILDYLNEYGLDKLVETYHLKVKEDNDFVLLKYDYLESPMGELVVEQARGSIFRKENDKWACICMPFYKFYNYGEEYVAKIDWKTASIQEKIDGSLIKFFNADGEWYCATNGMPNAKKAPTSFDENISYYNLICEVMGGEEQLNDFLRGLDADYTYMFELVSKKNKLVIDYKENALYGLGKRCMIDFKEDKLTSEDRNYMEEFGIKFPKTYQFADLAATIKFAKEMDISQEGFVVCDGNFSRIKIKGQAYLDAFHFRGNGLTKRKIIEAIQKETVDDMMAYFPEFRDEINLILKKLQDMASRARNAWKWLDSEGLAERKDRALYIQNNYKFYNRAYCFRCLKSVENPYDYLMELPVNKVIEFLEGENL